jgi:hypothetical protein
MNPYRLSESLKNYVPTHHILIDAARTIVYQAERIQEISRNRYHWKLKAEQYEKELIKLKEEQNK